jgi:hypothetical protein
MTAAVILAGLAPIMIGSGTGSEVMRRIAAPMLGGMITAPLVSMVLIPALYVLWKRKEFAINEPINRTPGKQSTGIIKKIMSWRPNLRPGKKKRSESWEDLQRKL